MIARDPRDRENLTTDDTDSADFTESQVRALSKRIPCISMAEDAFSGFLHYAPEALLARG